MGGESLLLASYRPEYNFQLVINEAIPVSSLFMSQSHEAGDSLMKPIHALNEANAVKLAKHYANLYHMGTDAAYQILGAVVEVEPIITSTEDGGADIHFKITRKQIK